MAEVEKPQERFEETKGAYHTYNQYTIRTKKRDELKAHLQGKNIPSMIYYPIAIHLQEVYKDLGYKKGDLPNCDNVQKEVLSLPIYPELNEEKIKERFRILEEIDPDVQSLQMLLPVFGLPMYEELKPYIEERDLAKWDFHHPVVRTKHLSREELGKLSEWANREFYSKGGRVQRILESKTLNPYPKEVFRSYMDSMENYAKAAIDEKIIV